MEQNIELKTVKEWVNNKDFITFLGKKGINITFVKDYSFGRIPKETQITSDFKTLKSYFESYNLNKFKK